MKKPSRETLKNKCDKLWKEIIKSVGRCEWCGRENGQMHAHHIFGRSRFVLRWDIRNGVCLCFQCHKPQGAHSPNVLNVERYVKWVKEYKADDWEYLSDKMKQPIETITTVKLMDILEMLKEAKKWL